MLKVGIFIFLFVASIAGYDYYKSYSIQSYCSDIKIGIDITPVLLKAGELEFIVPTYDETNSSQSLVIMNQMSPFFRFGCFLQIENNAVISKEFYAAD